MTMTDSERLFQTATLIAVVLFFEFMERRRPGHAVDRRRDLPLNLLALAVVIIAGEGWKEFILKFFSALNPARFFPLAEIRMLPGVVKIVIGVVLADLSLYWVHRGMHWNGLLWRTHVFHHSIEHLWWLSGSRTSVTHLFLFALPQVLIVYFLLQMSTGEAGVAFSIGVVVNIWIHTNIWVNLGPLEWILITPNFHRVHHGTRGLMRTNLGFVFTIWDRLFGTYADLRSTGKDSALGFVPTGNRLIRMVIGF